MPLPTSLSLFLFCLPFSFPFFPTQFLSHSPINQCYKRLNGATPATPAPAATHAPVCAPTIKLLPLPQRCRFDQRRLCVFFLYIFYFISCVSSSLFLAISSRENIYVALGEGRGKGNWCSRLGICMPLHSFD